MRHPPPGNLPILPVTGIAGQEATQLKYLERIKSPAPHPAPKSRKSATLGLVIQGANNSPMPSDYQLTTNPLPMRMPGNQPVSKTEGAPGGADLILSRPLSTKEKSFEVFLRGGASPKRKLQKADGNVGYQQLTEES